MDGARLVVALHIADHYFQVGPIAGSILAVLIYKIVKALEYETANADPETPAPTGGAKDLESGGEKDAVGSSSSTAGGNESSSSPRIAYRGPPAPRAYVQNVPVISTLDSATYADPMTSRGTYQQQPNEMGSVYPDALFNNQAPVTSSSSRYANADPEITSAPEIVRTVFAPTTQETGGRYRTHVE